MLQTLIQLLCKFDLGLIIFAEACLSEYLEQIVYSFPDADFHFHNSFILQELANSVMTGYIM